MKKKLIQDYLDFKDELRYYISSETKNVNAVKKINEFLNDDQEENNDYFILNYNYTNLTNLYVKDVKRADQNILNIHGTLETGFEFGHYDSKFQIINKKCKLSVLN